MHSTHYIFADNADHNHYISHHGENHDHIIRQTGHRIRGRDSKFKHPFLNEIHSTAPVNPGQTNLDTRRDYHVTMRTGDDHEIEESKTGNRITVKERTKTRNHLNRIKLDKDDPQYISREKKKKTLIEQIVEKNTGYQNKHDDIDYMLDDFQRDSSEQDPHLTRREKEIRRDHMYDDTKFHGTSDGVNISGHVRGDSKKGEPYGFIEHQHVYDTIETTEMDEKGKPFRSKFDIYPKDSEYNYYPERDAPITKYYKHDHIDTSTGRKYRRKEISKDEYDATQQPLYEKPTIHEDHFKPQKRPQKRKSLKPTIYPDHFGASSTSSTSSASSMSFAEYQKANAISTVGDEIENIDNNKSEEEDAKDVSEMIGV